MKRLINIVKAVCKRIMADFVQKRMLAEFPRAVSLSLSFSPWATVQHKREREMKFAFKWSIYVRGPAAVRS